MQPIPWPLDQRQPRITPSKVIPLKAPEQIVEPVRWHIAFEKEDLTDGLIPKSQ